MDSTTSMETRLEAAIDARRFNVLEMIGFQSKPRLALLAGAAIGYEMAVSDFREHVARLGRGDDVAQSGQRTEVP